jgi:hypothetical protein
VNYGSLVTISGDGDARPLTVRAPAARSDITESARLYAARRFERSG